MSNLKLRAEKYITQKKTNPVIKLENGKVRLEFIDLEANKKRIWIFPDCIVQLRGYQKEIVEAMLLHGRKRFYLAWSRRLGKEVTMWICALLYCFYFKEDALIVYPTRKLGTDILWEGGAKIKGRLVRYRDFIPRHSYRSNEALKRIYLPNGTKIWMVGSEQLDKTVRGINPGFIGLSEYAYQNPKVLATVLPILHQNKGVLFLQTTFNSTNFAHRHYLECLKDSAWLVSFLTCETAYDNDGNLAVSAEDLAEARKLFDEGMIQQEYYMNVNASAERFYFVEILNLVQANGAIGHYPCIPDSPLYTAWDLGVDDDMYIIGIQIVRGKPRLVFTYKNRGQTIPHYIEKIREYRLKHKLIHALHLLPHDGDNRTHNSMEVKPPSSKSIIEDNFYEAVLIVAKPRYELNGVNIIRGCLPMLEFDESATFDLVDALKNYQKEEDKSASSFSLKKVYKDTPRHDEHSHAVKALQTFCIAYYTNKLTISPPQEISYYIDLRGGV